MVACAVVGGADLVLVNGKIITVESSSAVAEAVAVRNERIVAVGRNAEISKMITDSTEIIDLEGRTVLPGLVDSHLHMLGTGLALTIIDCRTPPMRSIADIAAAVEEKARSEKRGRWIEGTGWDQAKLAEHRYPTRWDIDKVAPDNPVYLTRTCGHIAVVNSKALELAKISKDIPQPAGGELVKDVHGELTGLLKEKAQDLVRSNIPPPDLKKKIEAVKLASQAFSAVGLTSIVEAGITEEEFRAYQIALKEGYLKVRVSMMLLSIETGERIEESLRRIEAFPLLSGFGNDMLSFLGLKLFIDGGIGGRTALMREPYEGEDNCGILTTSEPDLQRLVDTANLRDMNIGVHCAGGKAMDIVLDSYENTDCKKPIRGRRFSLIHAYQPSQKNFEQCRRLGIVVASQPSFLYYLGDSYIENVGPKRSEWLKPHRSWIDNGIIIAAGTDSPVTPYNPFPSLWASAARKTEIKGTSMGTEQRVTREEAIKMYTLNGAYLMMQEGSKGSIAPGKLADMIVIDRDIAHCPLEEIRSIKVLVTILGGKIVHKA